MAGLMDMISNRDTSVDKSIAETTMQCLKEMKKQTGENVELVKKINTLVEASIMKIKSLEAKMAASQADSVAIEELRQEMKNIKSEFSDELTMIKNQLNEDINKENAKLYKNIKGILEEYDDKQQKKIKSIGRINKAILWFLFLITVLLITNILGII
ncbi:hypothetical protein C8E03_103374 [Lachnotalea glycerini]|uniref:DUF1640 domain-containing protein n=1 Tax=Lachnotalea glycerini TaxID=1763509 RepID=A0A318ENV4_9FIRM|nr:hypothetical protein [Lachnotalea glycerini]PXV91803.1 hypothetical protein C8E03_103374 [Lachnotalea glycerini]RDY31227.1 hypothetical protein CG710_010600 [Lachnotalea glycerini]